jgi:hypothetical protein
LRTPLTGWQLSVATQAVCAMIGVTYAGSTALAAGTAAAAAKSEAIAARHNRLRAGIGVIISNFGMARPATSLRHPRESAPRRPAVSARSG